MEIEGLLNLMDLAACEPDTDQYVSTAFRTTIDVVQTKMRSIRAAQEAVLAAVRSTHPCERENGGAS